jgi:hypothetical protein
MFNRLPQAYAPSLQLAFAAHVRLRLTVKHQLPADFVRLE